MHQPSRTNQANRCVTVAQAAMTALNARKICPSTPAQAAEPKCEPHGAQSVLALLWQIFERLGGFGIPKIGSA